MPISHHGIWPGPTDFGLIRISSYPSLMQWGFTVTGHLHIYIWHYVGLQWHGLAPYQCSLVIRAEFATPLPVCQQNKIKISATTLHSYSLAGTWS